MSDSTLIQDYFRKEGICNLMKVEHEHGKVYAGMMVEGMLEAIAIYVKGSAGAEAAFNVLTRHADKIIEPTVDVRGGSCR